MTDTDSFIIEIIATEKHYRKVMMDPLDKFDTWNYPVNDPLFSKNIRKLLVK